VDDTRELDPVRTVPGDGEIDARASDGARLPDVARVRHVAVTIALVLLALGGATAGAVLIDRYIDERARKVPEPEALVPRVRTLRVEPRSLSAHAEGTGFLRSSATVRVAAETSGKLLEKRVEEGAVVAKGDVLATIDDEVWKRRVAAAGARSESLRAQLVYLEKELEREDALAERGAGRAADRDRWLAEKRRIDAALDESAAMLAESELYVEKCRVVASRGGVWFEDLAQEGEFLQVGQPLGILRDIATLELEVEVSGHVRLALVAGSAVEVELLDVDPTLTRVPRELEGCAIGQLPAGGNEISHRFPVVITVPNASRELFPGLFARARFVLPREDEILLVAKECVADRFGRKAVFVVDASASGSAIASVRHVEVRALEDDPGNWRVVDGLVEGDVVIVSPLEQVRPGARVEPEIER